MKKISVRMLVMLSLLVILGLTVNAADVKTVKFVTDQEKEGGFLIEVTKEAFKRVGYDVKISYLPWARALANVMDGTDEALLGVYYNDERAAKMQYSELIGKSDIVFFKMASTHITYNKLEDLKPYTIGTIINTSLTPEFDNSAYIKKEAVPDYIANIKKLIAGRIPLFVDKKYVVLNTIKKQFPEYYEKIDYLPKPLTEGRYYNAFSKKITGYEQKVSDFNNGLKMIIKDGTFDKIMDKGLHE